MLGSRLVAAFVLGIRFDTGGGVLVGSRSSVGVGEGWA